VDINLDIDEGRRFNIRRIEFFGDRGPDQVLRGTMLIKEDEIFRRKNLVESIKKLNDMGLYDLIDHDQDVELLTDTESPTLDIRIRLSKKRH
jgi:outer membrane protein assembly factor BamA